MTGKVVVENELRERLKTFLRPSSAERWITCHGSIWEYTKLPKEPPNIKALMGVHAHKVAEAELSGGSDIALKATLPVDFQLSIDFYVDVVRSMVRASRGKNALEEKVFLDSGVEGTPDFHIISKNKLHVVDYKTGRIAVSSEDNEQMKLYALGILHSKEEECKDVDTVVMTILNQKISTFVMKRADLEEWNKIVVEAVKAIYKLEKIAYNQEQLDSHKMASKKACQWCRAKNNCNTYNQWRNRDFTI